MQKEYLHSLLEAKEKRKARQEKRRKNYPHTLISLSVNMPGNDKNHPLAQNIFEVMSQAVFESLTCKEVQVHKKSIHQDISGKSMLISLSANATMIKSLTCNIEQSHPLGRFMDIDVFDIHGKLYSRTELGFSPRKCYLCEKFAHECSRTQRHNMQDILSFMQKKVDNYVCP